MPTSSKPETSAIHRVLIGSGADPKLIHPAIEEIRHLSGQNVITAIGAQITELRSDVQTQITEFRAEMQAQINDLRTEMQAQINGLQVQITALPGGDANSIHRAPDGDEHPEQVHLGAHQPAVHSHARPALQDPHVVTQTDFGRGKIRRSCCLTGITMFRLRSLGWRKTGSRRSVKPGGTALVPSTLCHTTRYRALPALSKAFQNGPARYFRYSTTCPVFPGPSRAVPLT